MNDLIQKREFIINELTMINSKLAHSKEYDWRTKRLLRKEHRKLLKELAILESEIQKW